ncbi:MAG: hypothetical protein IMZ53_10980 [Thermoplasmata archaeon]|nr:hypothetical protein [Thermoplasmata archaeon]
MESKNFVISAKYSEFKTFLTDFLSELYGSTLKKRPIERMGNDFSTHLEYTTFGALIDFKILIIEEDLDIVLSVSDTQNENVQIHIDDIAKRIKDNFSSAKLPLGFANLISINNRYSIMLKERWSESEKTQKAKAYLSTIVLLGSILEGVLLYKIEENKAIANKSKYAPKDKNDKAHTFDKWTLEKIINVCYDCKWISKDAKSFSDGVKEYRNFVHPWKQLENKLDMPTDKTCQLSRKVIENVIEDLSKS